MTGVAVRAGSSRRSREDHYLVAKTTIARCRREGPSTAEPLGGLAAGPWIDATDEVEALTTKQSNGRFTHRLAHQEAHEARPHERLRRASTRQPQSFGNLPEPA
jgi:hypothetical protein